MLDFTMKTEGGHTKVYTPFNQDFISAAKASGAKWDVGAGAWTWPADRAEDAAAAHEQVFGFRPTSADVDMNDMMEAYDDGDHMFLGLLDHDDPLPGWEPGDDDEQDEEDEEDACERYSPAPTRRYSGPINDSLPYLD